MALRELRPLPPMTSTPASPDPLAALSASQRALLRIVCWVAWADGDFASEERELLETLVARLLPESAGVAAASAEAVSALVADNLQTLELHDLVAQLEGADQRQQAVKLALQMVSANQRPEDAAAINTAEKGAYRQLVEALNLPEGEVQEAEWAARQELQRGRSLLQLIGDTLSGFGSWPALEGSELPLGYWL